MTSPLLRFAALPDIDSLVRLRVLMQLDVHGIAEASADESYSIQVRDYFARAIAAGTYVSTVAEVAGDLTAAAGMVVFQKPPSLRGGSGFVGYISNVYTRPEWRRRGLASGLMKLLVERASTLGLDKLQLGATDAGRGVYEAVGFTPTRFPALSLSLVDEPPTERRKLPLGETLDSPLKNVE